MGMRIVDSSINAAPARGSFTPRRRSSERRGSATATFLRYAFAGCCGVHVFVTSQAVAGMAAYGDSDCSYVAGYVTTT